MSTLRLAGRIERDMAALLAEQLAALGPEDMPVEIDVAEADLADDVAASMIVAAIRGASERIGEIQVLHAPASFLAKLHP